MFIAEAARRAGVAPATLRYYERIGLLPRAPRRPSGYREYGTETVRIVRFIRRAQDLGLSLDDAAELLRLRKVTPTRRGAVRAVALRRLLDVDARIRALSRVRDALEALVRSCCDGQSPECPILQALDDEGGPS